MPFYVWTQFSFLTQSTFLWTKQPKCSPSILTKYIFPKLFNSMVYYLWKEGRYSASYKWNQQYWGESTSLTTGSVMLYLWAMQFLPRLLATVWDHIICSLIRKALRQASRTVKITWERFMLRRKQNSGPWVWSKFMFAYSHLIKHAAQCYTFTWHMCIVPVRREN